MLPIKISFSNLVHTNHSCTGIGLGIAQVASMACEKLGAQVDAQIFQRPEDLVAYLEEGTPKVACFSNFLWNKNLSIEFSRRIKEKSPETIIVFGGPNYPLDDQGQEEFLRAHPEIDFYIFREGELAFLELFNKLKELNFDVSELREKGFKIPNTHYLACGSVVRGDLLPQLKKLDEIPSPYLSGLCDNLLAQRFIPIMETKRGCPFKCTFCESGDDHYNRIFSFSFERAKEEVYYLAKKNNCPVLQMTDLNFGMYKDDIELCKAIAEVQKEYQWPKRFFGINGKNSKERVIHAASLVEGATVSAAVQSTDQTVLKSIKRSNISLDQMIQMAKGKESKESYESGSFSELILCLPGMTKEAHFKSIGELIDAGMGMVRSHQFIMLPGAEASNPETRKQFDLQTQFRVIPLTVSQYELFGEVFSAPEIDEICVASGTMPYDDYLECRLMDLTIEIFYNNGVFKEFFNFLKINDILISELIFAIHGRVREKNNPLESVYEGFLKDTKELWDTSGDVREFLCQPGVLDRYRNGELGNNEQLMYRGLAMFSHMEELHKIVFEQTKKLLVEKLGHDVQKINYLEELAEFSLMRKMDVLAVDKCPQKTFHFDFIGLMDSDFCDNPDKNFLPDGVDIVLGHTESQKNEIKEFVKLHSKEYELGNILSSGNSFENFFRKPTIVS
jgi:radical SAM superfamily enzyme YgiQ (UPF0313 family)